MSNAYVPASTGDDLDRLLRDLRDLVPGAFPDGILDVDLLLANLGEDGGASSSFSFSWPGIEQARDEARAATTATLNPDIDASLNWKAARDVLVQGDNLQVLKLLKAGYDREAKLIYIDPPYNTGESFTYNDDFSVRESDYLTSTGQLDEQGNATSSKIESAGRKHAPWLSFMFPRLSVARRLLRRDGVILVSIDNNEVHHLRLLLDAVFGSNNFVDMLTWQGGRKGDARLTAGGQDYVLVYARDFAYLKSKDTRWRERKSGLEDVYKKEGELRVEFPDDYVAAQAALRRWYSGLPEGNPAKQHSHYDRFDAGGVWTSDNSSSPNYRANLLFEYKGFAAPENGWRYDEAAMDRLDAEGKLIYPSGRASRIRIKKYLHDQEDWAPASTFYRDRSGASSALTSLMGAEVFDNPKNTDVLGRLFSSMTSDDDLIVDFFAGSGSTGQAVWEQNAFDGDTRRWILVQIPATPDEDEPSGKAAFAAGYSTIFEITAERLRRAAVMPTLSGSTSGFRVFRLAPSNLRIDPPVLVAEDTTNATFFDRALFHANDAPVREGADPLAVAWEVVLKSTATRLDARVEVLRIRDIDVYEFIQAGVSNDAGRLLVCFESFTLEAADELALSDRDTLILRGDVVDDAVTLTLAPRLQSRLVLLERIAREVSL